MEALQLGRYSASSMSFFSGHTMNIPIVDHGTNLPLCKTKRDGTMQEELDALQAQIRSLQALVSELLLINQTLRLEAAELKRKWNHRARGSDPQLRPYF